MDLSRTPHDATVEAWKDRKRAYEKIIDGLEVKDLSLISDEVQVERDALLQDLQDRWNHGDVLGVKRNKRPGEKSSGCLVIGIGSMLILVGFILSAAGSDYGAYSIIIGFAIAVLRILYSLSMATYTKAPPVNPTPPKVIYGFWSRHIHCFTDGNVNYSYTVKHANENLDLIDWVQEREISAIWRKWGVFNRGSDRKAAGIAAVEQMTAPLRKHFAQENYNQIPMDPAKQTPIQKLIVNCPLGNHHKIKCPETGMYWDVYDGFPCLPPEFEVFKTEKEKWEGDSPYVYDPKRSLMRNFFRSLNRTPYGNYD